MQVLPIVRHDSHMRLTNENSIIIVHNDYNSIRMCTALNLSCLHFKEFFPQINIVHLDKMAISLADLSLCGKILL